MRRRERARVEAEARSLLAEHAGAKLAQKLEFVWARSILDTHALAWYEARPLRLWIMFNEEWLARASARKRSELIAHEVAHLLAYHEHGEGTSAHGPQWRRWTIRVHGKALRA